MLAGCECIDKDSARLCECRELGCAHGDPSRLFDLIGRVGWLAGEVPDFGDPRSLDGDTEMPSIQVVDNQHFDLAPHGAVLLSERVKLSSAPRTRNREWPPRVSSGRRYVRPRDRPLASAALNGATAFAMRLV